MAQETKSQTSMGGYFVPFLSCFSHFIQSKMAFLFFLQWKLGSERWLSQNWKLLSLHCG